jgi:glycosyltransferase involved in cell wall biosynthesis
MPKYLSCGDMALSFIKSCFSKKGSSPTKVAEYLATGVPVVLNGDIGDQAELATDADACVVMGAFDDATLLAAADAALVLCARPVDERVRAGRRVAEARFGLDRGVDSYERLYRAIVAD